jgi:hypothetical protein
MAIITASPNPVGLYATSVSTKVRIDWNMQWPAGTLPVKGIVALLVNGTPKSDSLFSPDLAGSQDYSPIDFPNTYTFILRREDNKAEVARVDVATYDIRNEIIAGFAEAYVPDLRPQMITNVVVKPGVDTVRISFKTVHPTIPLTTLMDASGTKIDARFGLLGGLRTSHEAIFGVETPLQLEAKHKFRIVAARGAGRGGPKEAVVDGEFISGSRRVEVFFETVDVHADGDPWPSGSGDLMFFFGAGDAETASRLGEPWPEYGPDDISDDDPPVAVNKQISIPQGPRQLWLKVVAMENDSTYWPWDWWDSFSEPGKPDFSGAGSSYQPGGANDRAETAIVLDVGSEPDAWSMGFEMKTGDFPLDYVIIGHIEAELEAGSVIAPKMFKPRAPRKPVGTVQDAGAVTHIAALGTSKQAEAFVVGMGGELYHRTIRPEADQRDDWNTIALPGEGTVTVTSAAPDAVDMVFRGSDGSVSHRSFNPRKPKDQKWRRLGGNFRYVVPAIETSKGKDSALILFAVEEDGSLHVRDAQAGQDWDRLGDQPVTAVAPLAVDGAGVSLFATSADGRLLQFSRQRGRWRSQDIAPPAGGVPTTLLLATSFARPSDKGKAGGQDVVVAALGEDQYVRILRWPDYPRGEPEGRWEDLGPLQDLAIGKPVRKAADRKASAKPTVTKRGAARELA